MTDERNFVSGISTGLDTATIISKLMYIERAPIRALEEKKAELTSDKAAWQGLTAQLINFQMFAYSLSKETTFETKSALSSDEDYFTLSASSSAAVGSYQIEVPQIASSHQLISKGYEDYDVTTVGSGTFTIEQSGGNIDPLTRLDVINEQSGMGRGSIKIIDRSNSSATIDLSSAITIQDVLDTINNNTSVNVLASLNAEGTGINIRDKTNQTTVNFAIYDLSGGATAQDLGISTGTGGVAANYKLGSSIMTVGTDTDLDIINDGLGVRESNTSGDDFTILARDGTTFGINISSDTTLQDIITSINDDAGNDNGGTDYVTASLSGDGNSIILTDNTAASANDLIVYSTVSQTDLTSSPSIGGTSVTVASAAAYQIGDRIQIYDETNEEIEFRTLTGVDKQTNILTFGIGLENAYSGSDTVNISHANTIHDLGLEFSRNDSAAYSVKEGQRIFSGANTVLTSRIEGGSDFDDGSVQVTDRDGVISTAKLYHEVSTLLNGAANATDTTITVDDASDFRVGDRIRLVEGTTIEFKTISGITGTGSATSITLDSGLSNSFSDNMKVYTRVDTMDKVIDRLNTARVDMTSRLSASASSGQPDATLVQVDGMAATDVVVFAEGANVEFMTIDSISSNTLTFTGNLSNTYSADLQVWQTAANDTLNGAVSAGATSLILNDATGFSVGDEMVLYENNTTEQVRITAVSGNTITFANALENSFSNAINTWTTTPIATTINDASIASSDDTITVNSAADLSVGDRVLISENDVSVYKTIESIDVNNITFTESVDYAFSNNLYIYKTSNVTSGVNNAANGIKLSDNTSSTTDNLEIEAVNGSAGSQLGITGEVTSGISKQGADLDHQWQAENTRLETLNFEEGMYRGKIKITDRSGANAEIDLSSTTTIKTLGDVIDEINDTAGISVTASINLTGDGLLITDDTGSTSSNLIIEEVSGGSTAADLNIEADVAANSKDGTWESSFSVSSSDTLEDIKSAINNLDIKVNATIINDGSQANPYKLMLTSEESGTIGKMVISADLSGGRGLDFTATSAARDSAILIGTTGSGASAKMIIKNSTKITDAIQGVTINLIKETTQAENITISDDYEGVISSVSQFVSGWNTLNTYIKNITKYDPLTKAAGELIGDVTVLNIHSKLLNIMTSSVTGVTSDMSTLQQAGIAMAIDGSLALNSSTLEDELRTDLEKVKKLFGSQQNIGLSTLGSSATASSTDGSYSLTGAQDGNTKDTDFASGTTGWKSQDESPDDPWYQLTFDATYELSKLKIFMVDTPDYPASSYALNGYQMQYWNPASGVWATQATIANNTLGTITHSFDRVQYASKIRLYNIDMDGKIDEQARIVEVEAYTNRGIGGRVNDIIKTFTDSTDGTIATKEDAIDEDMKTVDNRLEDLEDIMEMKELRMIKQFAAMESAIGEMQNKSNWLSSQLESAKNGWVKN